MPLLTDIFRTFAVIALVAVAPPAQAEIFTIATTSNNIHCDVGDDPETTSLMCTIFERSGSFAEPKPKDCDRSWGHFYFISQSGPVMMLCIENQPSDWPGNVQFEDGETSDFQGVICYPTPDQLTCRNRDGHGFYLSQTSQRVF